MNIRGEKTRPHILEEGIVVYSLPREKRNLSPSLCLEMYTGKADGNFKINIILSAIQQNGPRVFQNKRNINW